MSQIKVMQECALPTLILISNVVPCFAVKENCENVQVNNYISFIVNKKIN